MDAARHQLFTHPAFAGDHHVGIAVGHLADQGEDLLHRRAGADNIVETAGDMPLALFRIDLLQGLFYRIKQFFRGERLLDKIEHPAFDRLDAFFQRTVAGHHDHRQVGVLFLDHPHQRHSVHARHLQIADDQHKIVVGVDCRQGGIAGAGGGDGISGPVENALIAGQHLGFVVNDQYLKLFHSHSLFLSGKLLRRCHWPIG